MLAEIDNCRGAGTSGMADRFETSARVLGGRRATRAVVP